MRNCHLFVLKHLIRGRYRDSIRVQLTDPRRLLFGQTGHRRVSDVVFVGQSTDDHGWRQQVDADFRGKHVNRRQSKHLYQEKNTRIHFRKLMIQFRCS